MFLLYKGPSLIDGKPIVAAITGINDLSTNRKTGPMAQMYILREDISPVEAVKTGEDYSVCGNCPHRGENGKGRSCYVDPWRGPQSVWRALPKYKPYVPGVIRAHQLGLRLGAYGATAAIPFEYTEQAAKDALYTTGYDHEWRTCDQRLKKYLMASCDSEQDRIEAKAMGWTTFRVKTPEQPKLAKEYVCPASEEAGFVAKCFTCKKCSGDKAKDVVINVHGTRKRHFKLEVA